MREPTMESLQEESLLEPLEGLDAEEPVIREGLAFATIDGQSMPSAPETMADTGLNPVTINDLALKLAASTTQFTSQWAARQLCLPKPLVDEIFWELKSEREVEILGNAGPMNYRYSISERGRERADRLREVCGYVGPTPVSLDAYIAMLRHQRSVQPPVALDAVRDALSRLVLTSDAIEVAALAAASGRSLFMFGPPGNGKTTVGHLLHNVFHGEMWVPHAIQVDSHVIRVFDPQVHEPIPGVEDHVDVDHRWIRIRRPFVVAGGEMTIEELDLAWSPSLRFYEAPPHLKANGGTFMIDDFGRQRMAPRELLNRWIVPLERRIDYVTLNTGQKIEVPFDLMLVVATNLTVEDVADPAFLRRMGYRLHMHAPTPEEYREVFRRYAAEVGTECDTAVLDSLLERYQSEGRELRSSEPRDLVERCADICKLRGRPFELTTEILGAAWRGYFGNQ